MIKLSSIIDSCLSVEKRTHEEFETFYRALYYSNGTLYEDLVENDIGDLSPEFKPRILPSASVITLTLFERVPFVEIGE